MNNNGIPDIIIVGGGAAGMLAACVAADRGAAVTLFERGDMTGRKLRITGKGRCNLTNNCNVNDLLSNIQRNKRFMYSAAYSFPPQDIMAYFETLGVPLKTERGNRVFPVSDNASDIVNALRREMKRTGVVVITGKRIESVITENGHVCGVASAGERFPCANVIVATGGLSYPKTGSTGDGYAIARSLGISVTPLSPSLVPLVISGKYCPMMQGLSLKNTSLRLIDTVFGKTVYEDFGELLFTHFGMSGPTVLSASAHISDPTPSRYVISLDLKSALDDRELDKRLLSDFSKYSNRDLSNSLGDLLPKKMIPVVVSMSGIPGDRKINSITKDERAALAAVLKDMRFTVTGKRPIDEAIITSGGIDVGCINPHTMESKTVKGLYFAGEVIDVDAYTGGFNLTIAFETAHAAACAAASEPSCND